MMPYTQEEKQAAFFRLVKSSLAMAILVAGYPLLFLFGALIWAGEYGMTRMVSLAARLNAWAAR